MSIEYRRAEKLALCLQRKFRGDQARIDARIARYERYQRAALVIQWAYRSYRVIQLARRRLSTDERRISMSNKITVKNNTSAGIAAENKEKWRKLLAGESNFQEKADLWRNIVELRRAYGYSTDLCLKALLHADGDLSRALSIIGNEDFNFRYGGDKLPPDIYAMFMPTIAATLSKQQGHSSSASKFRLTVSMNKRTRKREIKAHKKLHDHLHAAHHMGSENEVIEDENTLIDLSEIMWKSYLVNDKRSQYSKSR